MVDFRHDQAAGLRALLRRIPVQRMALASLAPGCGATRLATALAVVLAEQGYRVALIDEFQGAGSATARLGLSSRLDLLQVVNHDTTLARLRLASAQGISVFPAARLAAQNAALSRLQMAELEQAFARIERDHEILLIDAAPNDLRLSAAARRAERLVVACNDTQAALTGAYALIKRHAGQPAPAPAQLELLYGGCTQARAQAAHANLAALCAQQLRIGAGWLGWLAQESKFSRSGNSEDTLKLACITADKWLDEHHEPQGTPPELATCRKLPSRLPENLQ
ncbi:MAG: AAA family ATPase [Rhodocyclaceae bacterium]|nr:AAA family ATPase [Rhodocyclaceae bacterium]MBX3667153.1 AAA family ATPase [Rhodocyclaceae bacterium]